MSNSEALSAHRNPPRKAALSSLDSVRWARSFLEITSKQGGRAAEMAFERWISSEASLGCVESSERSTAERS